VKIVKARDGRCVFWARTRAHNLNLLDFGDAADLFVLTMVKCSGRTEAHEPEKRSQGADETDPEQCIALCAFHHRWVHDHPRLAALLGLLGSKKFDPLPLLGSAGV
jgi:hypothetical protein